MENLPVEAFVPSHFRNKVTCEKMWRWEMQLEDFDLWYVVGGEGSIRINDTLYDAFQGQCFLLRPGDKVHAWHNPQKPLTVGYLHFSVQGFPHNLPDRVTAVGEAFFFEGMMTRYMDLLWMRPFAYRQEEQLLIKQMLLHLLRCKHRKEYLMNGSYCKAVHEACEYIRQHPAERIPIAELAEKVKISPRQFAMHFRRITGKTPESYIIQNRLDRAEYLLRYSGMNVSEVAEALGYQNLFFFSRQFKKYRRKSPGIYKT